MYIEFLGMNPESVEVFCMRECCAFFFLTSLMSFI